MYGTTLLIQCPKCKSTNIEPREAQKRPDVDDSLEKSSNIEKARFYKCLECGVVFDLEAIESG